MLVQEFKYVMQVKFWPLLHVFARQILSSKIAFLKYLHRLHRAQDSTGTDKQHEYDRSEEICKASLETLMFMTRITIGGKADKQQRSSDKVIVEPGALCYSPNPNPKGIER